MIDKTATKTTKWDVERLRIKFVQLLMWLSERIDNLLERFDRCCYPGCTNRADHWCITGGHRHCYEHESGFYSDVEFCQSCYYSMTPEERAAEIAEADKYAEEML